MRPVPCDTEKLATPGDTKDITQLILDDHHEQRRRFAILEQIDAANVTALGNIWSRLAVLLEVHAAAEEAIFYPELVRLAVGPQPVVVTIAGVPSAAANINITN